MDENNDVLFPSFLRLIRRDRKSLPLGIILRRDREVAPRPKRCYDEQLQPPPLCLASTKVKLRRRCSRSSGYFFDPRLRGLIAPEVFNLCLG